MVRAIVTRRAKTCWSSLGKIHIGGSTLGPGDYIYTEAGEVHDLHALEDSVIYVSSEKPVTILEKYLVQRARRDRAAGRHVQPLNSLTTRLNCTCFLHEHEVSLRTIGSLMRGS